MSSPLPHGALSSPAAGRNRAPILDVLRQHLPARGLVLEIASGAGEHAAWFAQALPELTWQPTDRDEEGLRSIAAWRDAVGLPNLLLPLLLDVTAPVWPVARADAVVCINMLHIAPWRAAEGLMAGAARVLPAGAPLYVYGPFREGGVHTAPSNAAFDRDLRARDPAWGVRDLDEVVAIAARRGLMLAARATMPANNLSVVLTKR